MKLLPIDDGFKPGKTDKPTLLAVNGQKRSEDFVSIFDDLLEEVWCDRVYQYSSKIHGGKPWGVYVLTRDLLDFDGVKCEDIWEKAVELSKSAAPEDSSIADDNTVDNYYGQEVHDLYQRAIGIYTSRKLLHSRGSSMLGSDLISDSPRIHGTVVWSLCSSVSSKVEYHIDYAELYRYETNIIHPPLYAGTVQVSPLGTSPVSSENFMKGGAFLVNTSGLDHYKKFGYKGKLSAPEVNNNDKGPSPALMGDIAANPSWQEVRYKRNRGILHDGNFPHLSTPVEVLPCNGVKRCILGFNCFTDEVGESCMRAPEHSRAFNRTIRLYQALASTTMEASIDKTTPTEREKVRLTPKEVLKNPALARLLIAAAKLKKATALDKNP